jgi:hypothetical protein
VSPLSSGGSETIGKEASDEDARKERLRKAEEKRQEIKRKFDTSTSTTSTTPQATVAAEKPSSEQVFCEDDYLFWEAMSQVQDSNAAGGSVTPKRNKKPKADTPVGFRKPQVSSSSNLLQTGR